MTAHNVHWLYLHLLWWNLVPSDPVLLSSGQREIKKVTSRNNMYTEREREDREGVSFTRWTSKGRSVTGRKASTTRGPIVMLGTKRPSITSTWIQSQPAHSTAFTWIKKKKNKQEISETAGDHGMELWKGKKEREREERRTCSPSLAKLAERMEGETMISLLENLSTRAVAFTTPWLLLLQKRVYIMQRFILFQVTNSNHKLNIYAAAVISQSYPQTHRYTFI